MNPDVCLSPAELAAYVANGRGTGGWSPRLGSGPHPSPLASFGTDLCVTCAYPAALVRLALTLSSCAICAKCTLWDPSLEWDP